MLRYLPSPVWFLWVAFAMLPCAGSGQEITPALREADAAYRAGQAALGQRDLSAAQADFEKVVRLAPGAEQGHSALGSVLLSRGQPKAAIHELETALAIQRSDSIAQLNLATAYQQVGLPEKAIPLFASLEAGARLQRRPLSAAVLAAYARALAAKGDLRSAEARVKAAVRIEPGNAELQDDLGSLYAQEREWPAAQSAFVEATRLAPEMAIAHLHLGLAMEAQGEPGGLKELARAAQLDPENDMVAVELGKGYATAGQDEAAVAQFQGVLGREPGSTVAMFEMALALQRLGKLEEAIALLRKVVAVEPKNADALANLGMALTQAQQAKDAVPVLQRSIAAAPGGAIAHEDLAAAYVQLNQMDDAIVELHTALKLSPDLPQLHYDLGLALKMQDHPAAAIPELEAAARLDAASPEAPYALGLLYLQAARYTDAARELKRSLDLRPQNGDGWATLGSVYDKLNMLPEAVAALREATRQLPDQPDPHLTLAAVLAKQSQPAEAMEERKKGAELMRSHMNRQRAEVAANAGDGLLRKGDLEGAAERFRDALSYDGTYREGHLGMARVLEAQGKAVEAAAERERAEAISKGSVP